MIISQSVHS